MQLDMSALSKKKQDSTSQRTSSKETHYENHILEPEIMEIEAVVSELPALGLNC